MHTSDLYLSAFLLTSGMRLMGHSKKTGRVYFEFEAHQDLPQLKRIYYNRTGRIPAHEFVENIRLLKHKVNEEMEHG